MRLFVATHLNSDVLREIGSFLSPLKSFRGVKWVAVDNLHITLKFLGETEDKKLGLIIDELNQISASPFKLSIKETGAFPHLKNPRVIWIGVDGELDKCNELYQSVEDRMDSLGFPFEKRDFKPHLTIGRVKGKVHKSVINELEKNKSKNFGEVEIKSFSLMESKLTPKGSIYNELERFTLE